MLRARSYREPEWNTSGYPRTTGPLYSWINKSFGYLHKIKGVNVLTWTRKDFMSFNWGTMSSRRWRIQLLLLFCFIFKALLLAYQPCYSRWLFTKRDVSNTNLSCCVVRFKKKKVIQSLEVESLEWIWEGWGDCEYNTV